jgi:hypothetical protein
MQDAYRILLFKFVWWIWANTMAFNVEDEEAKTAKMEILRLADSLKEPGLNRKQAISAAADAFNITDYHCKKAGAKNLGLLCVRWWEEQDRDGFLLSLVVAPPVFEATIGKKKFFSKMAAVREVRQLLDCSLKQAVEIVKILGVESHK